MVEHTLMLNYVGRYFDHSRVHEKLRHDHPRSKWHVSPKIRRASRISHDPWIETESAKWGWGLNKKEETYSLTSCDLGGEWWG